MHYQCETCSGVLESVDLLAEHLMNAHGVNRTRAHNIAGEAPVVVSPWKPEPVSDAIREAAKNLNSARTHAESLNALGIIVVGLAALGLLLAFIGAATDDGGDASAVVFLLPGLLGAIVVWAVLKAISLHLLLMVDKIAIEGDD